MKPVSTAQTNRPIDVNVLRNKPKCPQLLISIRDRDELATVLAGGVDIVDLKEPGRGPLAPADAELWSHAATVWERLRPASMLSAALGEREDAIPIAKRLPTAFRFAKVGPSACHREDDIGDLWAAVREQLDDRIELVAVAYADFHAAETLPPQRIFELAAAAGMERCLIDTFVKDGRSTVDHLGAKRLACLARVAREAELWWALAGSIRVSCIPLLQQHDAMPDCFGVRGDVCRQGRAGRLSGARVTRWKESLWQQCSSLSG